MPEWDLNALNSDLLSLYNLLDIRNPVTTGTMLAPPVKRMLKSLGWEEGEPLPGGLQNYIAAVLETFKLRSTRKNLEIVMADDTVKYTLSTAIQKMRDYLAPEKRAVEQARKTLGIEHTTLNPVNAELLRAATEWHKQQIQNEAVESSIVSDFEYIGEDAQGEEVEPEKKSETTTDTGDVTPVPPRLCPCCGWDLFTILPGEEVTEEDEQRYLAYVLGSQEFRKTYNLWHGNMKATFRTLSMEESSWIDEQLAKEYQEGKLKLGYQIQVQRSCYQAAMSLCGLELPDTDRVAPVLLSSHSPMFEATKDKTRCELFFKNGFCKTLPAKVLQDAIIAQWQIFEVHLKYLQHRLNSEDFWKGLRTR